MESVPCWVADLGGCGEGRGDETRVRRVLKERVKGGGKGAVGHAVREGHGPILGWEVRGDSCAGDSCVDR